MKEEVETIIKKLDEGERLCKEHKSQFSINFILSRKQAKEITQTLRNPLCPHCGKYKATQGNGIMHQLCECGG